MKRPTLWLVLCVCLLALAGCESWDQVDRDVVEARESIDDTRAQIAGLREGNTRLAASLAGLTDAIAQMQETDTKTGAALVDGLEAVAGVVGENGGKVDEALSKADKVLAGTSEVLDAVEQMPEDIPAAIEKAGNGVAVVGVATGQPEIAAAGKALALLGPAIAAFFVGVGRKRPGDVTAAEAKKQADEEWEHGRATGAGVALRPAPTASA